MIEQAYYFYLIMNFRSCAIPLTISFQFFIMCIIYLCISVIQFYVISFCCFLKDYLLIWLLYSKFLINWAWSASSKLLINIITCLWIHHSNNAIVRMEKKTGEFKCRRLQWVGVILRREEVYVLRKVLEGNPEQRWLSWRPR